jgi:mRNA deadenylase 3'-5' endonuclease subunit Ccr4
VIGGDFNSTFEDSAIAVMQSQTVNKASPSEDYRAVITHYNKLLSDRKLYTRLQPAYEASPGQFTNWSVSFKGTMDHIFYNNLELVSVLELPDCDRVCPNMLFPSDHFRIEAKFHLY